MNEQLERVALNLSQSIIKFWELRVQGLDGHGKPIVSDFPTRFTANELRQFVNASNFGTAPASADRVLRQLRTKKQLNYALTNRTKSLYTALPVEVEVLNK
jgi:hypothetical protein